MRINRVPGSSRALLLAVLVLAAACTGGGEAPASSGPPRKELRVGFAADQYATEGLRPSVGVAPLNANIIETLAYLSPKYEVRPLLAERWELRPPNTWRFFLRRDVKFHDGQPFNAKAVKEGLFDRLAKAGGGQLKAGPDSAVVVDDFTIDFTPTVTNLRVPEQLVHPESGVYAAGSDPGSKPTGTGPFVFVDHVPNKRIAVRRNAEYWGQRPKLERIDFFFYPDSRSRIQALESGKIDLAFPILPQDAESVDSRQLDMRRSGVGAHEVMYASIHRLPPDDLLSDTNVRKAVALAIDRKKLVSDVLGGRATTDQTYVPRPVLARQASLIKGFPYDPDKARGMLDAAGWKPGRGDIRVKEGRRLELTLVSGYPSAETHRLIPEFLQEQLREIGIDLAIVERRDTESYTRLLAERGGDLFLEQGNQNDANPAFLPVNLLFGEAGSGGSGYYQALFAPGQTFDELLAPTLTEASLDKVRESTARAMHQAIDEQAAVIPLAGIYEIYGMSRAVRGFVPHPSLLSVRWTGVSVGG